MSTLFRLCQHCGTAIERIVQGWRHVMTEQAACPGGRTTSAEPKEKA